MATVIVREEFGAAGIKDAWTLDDLARGCIPYRFGRFTPEDATAVWQVKALVAEQFALPETTTDTGCHGTALPPVETVVTAREHKESAALPGNMISVRAHMASVRTVLSAFILRPSLAGAAASAWVATQTTSVARNHNPIANGP